MLKSIHVESFESLHDVSLDLGKFTVVVGESSNGKSALIRAVNALAFNIRGSNHVTFGHKYATIRAVLDGWEITLQRGEGKHVYTVTDRSSGLYFPPFERLNGAVPEKVSEILGIGETNIANQEDSPFLLKDSGAQVARVLGELTNVSTIFEAVQIGNRKRLAFSGEMKTRQSDFAAVQQELKEFENLPLYKAYVENLEQSLVEVEELDTKGINLEIQVVDLQDIQSLLDSTPEYPDVPEIGNIEQFAARRRFLLQIVQDFEDINDELRGIGEYPDPPSLDEVLEIQERYNLLKDMVSGLESAILDMRESKNLSNEMETLELNLEETLHDLLVEAGICPTCNQTIPR